MNIARFIDHTTLNPAATKDDVDRLCAEAAQNGFATVCLSPFYVSHAAGILRGTPVKVATVIGFPFGYTYENVKVSEARTAITHGASELDMVINIAALKNSDFQCLEQEAAAVLEVVRKEGALLKVIIETGLLNIEEIISCCALYAGLGVDFVKTSTGYAEKGASVDVVELMRSHLPDSVGIKASGGIKTFDFAQALLVAGATRLGCSASIAIVKGARASESTER